MDELAKCIAYCCATRGTRETIITGKLIAVDVLHEQWAERSLPLNHFHIKAINEVIRGARGGGTQRWVRRSQSCEMLK